MERALRRKLPKLIATDADKRILIFERDHFNFFPEQILDEIENQRQAFLDCLSRVTRTNTFSSISLGKGARFLVFSFTAKHSLADRRMECLCPCRGGPPGESLDQANRLRTLRPTNPGSQSSHSKKSRKIVLAVTISPASKDSRLSRRSSFRNSGSRATRTRIVSLRSRVRGILIIKFSHV